MIEIPKFLHTGCKVAIVSPSGPIDSDVLIASISILELWGLEVQIGNNVYARAGVFAGTDEQRCADFQAAINDQEIKAIFCSRGGYGAIRIVENIDYSPLQTSPKWIIGFSDITVFHAKLANLQIASIHGAMPKNFTKINSESLNSLHSTLFGNSQTYNFAATPYNKTGIVRGELIGGNLSMLYSMRGVPFEYNYSNKILFIEDLNEYLYHIDRIMQNLKLSGILSQIKGLIVGTMSDMKNGIDVFESSIEGIILDAVKEYSYPVCFHFPSGHDAENMALLIGAEYSLQITPEICSLQLTQN